MLCPAPLSSSANKEAGCSKKNKSSRGGRKKQPEIRNETENTGHNQERWNMRGWATKGEVGDENENDGGKFKVRER